MNKKVYTILTTLFIILCIGIAILDAYTSAQNRYLFYLKTGIGMVALGYFLLVIINLIIVSKPFIIRWCKNWGPILIVIAITLAIPAGIHIEFYKGQVVSQDSFLTAYATYLTFVGAFSLGYFLYKREENRRENELRKTARLLYETINNITINFSNFDGYIQCGYTFCALPTWRSDYLDIQHLVKYEETALHRELEFFFNRIEDINKAIETGDKKRAKNLYLNFEKKEKYAAWAYNYLDAEDTLLSISLDMPQQKPWKLSEKGQIEKYANQFFDVVNIWVYNYLLRNGITSCDALEVEYELVDWLLTNPELKNWVSHSYEKRKITAVIFKIALDMSKKSDKLNYCWGEYSLKV